MQFSQFGDSQNSSKATAYHHHHRPQHKWSVNSIPTCSALIENFWRISLYVTDDAIFRKALCDVKFRQIEGNGWKFRHIELSNSVIS